MVIHGNVGFVGTVGGQNNESDSATEQSMSAARQEGSVTRRVKVNPGIRKDPIPDVVGSESTAPAELRLVLAFGIPPTHPH